jgi:hypothetical protein
MEKIGALIANPILYGIIELLGRGDVQFNKELILIARHMGLAEGTGNFTFEALRREFDRNVVKAPAVYEYVVRESIPEWLSSSFPPILGTYSCVFGFISERLYGLKLVSGDMEFSDHDQDSEGESDQD